MEEKEYQQIIEQWKEDNKELIESGKCRKIFTDNLPKWKDGKNKGSISWFDTFGKIVRFIYDNTEGNVEIINYDSTKQQLIVRYDNKEINIKTGSFINCNFGRKFGAVKYSNNFYYDIGKMFKDDKRDITIIDREIRKDKRGVERRWYKYTCNRCNWTEGWITEGHIDEGNGCSCCANRTPVLGINTIWDTDKWMIPIINDEEFCKTHTHSCSDSIYPTCLDCGRKKSKKMTINSIYCRHGIACVCSDNFPITEKIMFNVLEQLEVDFEYHKTFEWSKKVQVNNPKLCGSKEYDFYFELNDKEHIIETHGGQHYTDGKFATIKDARSFEEEVENDRIKKELAISNGIEEENYMIINCSSVYFNDIKHDILESNLNTLFNLNKINWNDVKEFASCNLIKIACDYKRNNPNLFTGDISKIMKISQNTVGKFLKIGNELGWCYYNVTEENTRKNEMQSALYGKKLKCIELDMMFNSLKDCSKYFKKKLNIQLFSNCIGMVCNNNLESYKGYHFEFVN